ncbi:MAG: tetratricopeptide repeat protein [Minwuia sp.]|uniref:tetratricopeptide repeat protein n=1 Tax=Minwuia sp. TaxID=2493630 RepID=UPI003A875956
MLRQLILMSFSLMLLVAGPAAAQEAELTKEQEAEIFAVFLADAKEGDAAAQYKVAVAYYTGRGVSKSDKIESAFWLQKAADQGHKQAISRLAWHYRNGVGVIQNLPQSEELYKKAYTLGVVGSSVPLAAIYRSGEGTPVEEGGQGRVRENHTEAVRWALIAADAGIDRGQNLMGELYRDGVGVPQDFAKALEWFELSAEQDFALAYFNASKIYRDPELEGFSDTEKGIRYLKLAADKGHAGAMIDLALAYVEGTDVPQNYDLALEWYSKAAAKNRRSAVQLAKAYESGLFGDPDPAHAYKWYYIARESGEVSGIVGALATKDKISEPVRLSMEREGNKWLREITN